MFSDREARSLKCIASNFNYISETILTLNFVLIDDTCVNLQYLDSSFLFVNLIAFRDVWDDPINFN